MSPSILLAEDEAFLRELIHMDIEGKGFEVRLASDGLEAIREIDERQPDLLLLDLLMPRKDGYGVLEHIRAHGYEFPIVIMSNLSDPAEQEKCERLGAKGFIVKSNIDDGELWEAIRPFVRR
jgi:CheY-like chemotaxis protein